MLSNTNLLHAKDNLKYLFWAFWIPVVCFAAAIAFCEFVSPDEYDESKTSWDSIIASRNDLIWEQNEYEINGEYVDLEVADISGYFPAKLTPTLFLTRENDDFGILVDIDGKIIKGAINKDHGGNFFIKLDGKENRTIPLGNIDEKVYKQTFPISDLIFIIVIITFFITLTSCCLSRFNRKPYYTGDYLKYVTGWTLVASIFFLIYCLWHIFTSTPLPSYIANYYPSVIIGLWVVSECSILSGVYYFADKYTNQIKESKNIFVREYGINAGLTPVGIWFEVKGENTLIINEDGSAYLVDKEENYTAFTASMPQEGCIMLKGDNGKILMALLNFYSGASYANEPDKHLSIPVIDLNGNEYTKDGKDYNVELSSFAQQQKRLRTINQEVDTIYNDVLNKTSLPKFGGRGYLYGWFGVALYFSFCLIFPNYDEGKIGAMWICIGISILLALLIAVNYWLLNPVKKKKEELKDYILGTVQSETIRGRDTGKRLSTNQITQYILAWLNNSTLRVDEWVAQNNK